MATEPLDPIAVFELDRWVCHICDDITLPALRGTMHGFAPELDHVVPLAQGGAHTLDNVACAHRRCNGEKGDGRRPSRAARPRPLLIADLVSAA